MIKILVSAVNTPVAISYLSHLRANGFYVIGIDIFESKLARHSCDEYHIVPRVGDNYLDSVSRIKFDFFLPWLDEEHILFAKKHRTIPFYDKIITSEPDSILISTDKIRCFQYLNSEGISLAPLTDTAPAFVRKRFSRGSKNALLVLDTARLNEFDDSYIKQRQLNGPEYTVDVLCDLNGNVLFNVPRRRIIATNISLVGRVELDNEISDFVYDICSLLKFKGCINIQIIREGDKLYLVEINPRLAGTSILSIRAGFDLLIDSIRLFNGEEIKKQYSVNNLAMYRYYREYYVFEEDVC